MTSPTSLQRADDSPSIVEPSELGRRRRACIERLNRLVRRQPTALLGVVDFWLGPQTHGDRLDLEA